MSNPFIELWSIHYQNTQWLKIPKMLHFLKSVEILNFLNFFKTLWSVWIWQAQFVLQVFCLFYLIGGISLTNGTAVKTILVISSLYVEKHSFKINILSKRIPWNFTQFDRMLRMQIFCTYDELMGVQKFRRSASQYKYNS